MEVSISFFLSLCMTWGQSQESLSLLYCLSIRTSSKRKAKKDKQFSHSGKGRSSRFSFTQRRRPLQCILFSSAKKRVEKNLKNNLFLFILPPYIKRKPHSPHMISLSNQFLLEIISILSKHKIKK